MNQINPATAKQVQFIAKLVEERDLPDEARLQFVDRLERWHDDPEVISKKRASDWIVRLLDQPEKPREFMPLAVPPGRYAFEHQGETQLVRVWRGSRNPNIVMVFAVQGTERGDRLDRTAERNALKLIEEQGVGSCAIAFGHRTSHCSKCGAKLRKNLSRKLGIGPTCLVAFVSRESANAMRREAREELREAGIDPNGDYAELATA